MFGVLFDMQNDLRFPKNGQAQRLAEKPYAGSCLDIFHREEASVAYLVAVRGASRILAAQQKDDIGAVFIFNQPVSDRDKAFHVRDYPSFFENFPCNRGFEGLIVFYETP
jgi:hypothetical protein